MSHQTSEKEWQYLANRISGMLDRYLNEDILAIEHKPSAVGLLQAPSEYLDSRRMENAE
ncbi:MAG: hypothetical protein ACYDGO_07185 [Smithellaceae bacterium]